MQRFRLYPAPCRGHRSSPHCGGGSSVLSHIENAARFSIGDARESSPVYLSRRIAEPAGKTVFSGQGFICRLCRLFARSRISSAAVPSAASAFSSRASSRLFCSRFTGTDRIGDVLGCIVEIRLLFKKAAPDPCLINIEFCRKQHYIP